MADFKIKSTAGTGNLTLLQSQDQSGSDYAIKIGDSGASTLTNATLTAPTITDLSNVSGTPSAITLTNATFPAGHVIQTKRIAFDAGGTGRSMDTSTTMTTINLGQGNLELTGITMTEDNICHCTLAGMNWLSMTDKTYSTFIEIWDGSAARYTYEFYSDQDSGETLQIPLSLSFAFLVPASFSNKTISPRIQHQTSRPAGTSSLSARTTLNDVMYFFMVQEIQQ